MKPYHENNGAAIYVGSAATVNRQSFVLMLTLQLNILTGTFSYWPVAPVNTFKIHCGLCTVKGKMLTSLSGPITITFY